MAPDIRSDIYSDLHGGQLQREEERNHTSAEKILAKVFELISPSSVLDVGCGLGTWLQVAQGLGAQTVQGVEGTWIDSSKLKIDLSLVKTCDLEKGFDLERQYDLVISLEVGEHLAPEAAETFVASLVKHSDVVLFSAAIPFQGGHHHVNEQFLPYWASLFSRHGFLPVDCLRGMIWEDKDVHWWLRQNIVIFAHPRALEKYPLLKAEAEKDRGPLSIVSPGVYQSRIMELIPFARRLESLMSILSQGGTFRVSFKGQEMNLEKVD